jgi:hypothetical protein
VVAGKLSEAAAVSLKWAANNGIAFDHGKTKAALFYKKRTVPTAKIEVGDTLARSLVGVATHLQGAPRHLAKEGKVCH